MYTKIILCLQYVYYYYLYMNIDKILNKIINLLLVIILLISIIILSIFITPNSYALDFEDFNVVYYNGTPSTNSFIEGISAIKYPSKYATVYKTYDSVTEPVYFFLFGASAGNYQGSYCYITLADLTNYPSGTLSWFNKPNGGSGVSKSTMTGATKFGNDRFRYYSNSISYSNENITEFYCPVYSTLEEGLNAFIDWYDNPPQPEPSLYEGLNIPPGYIARIQVKNGSQFTMITTMGTDNIAYQDKWVYTSQWYKFNDTSNPESAMATDGITIPWIRYGNTNILGQTNKAQYTINSTVGSYVWVLNPAYMVGQNADLYDTKLNSSIQLTNVTDILQVRIFALKSTYTWGGIVSSTSTGSGIEYDTDNGSWVNDNGDPVDPVDYGDTNVPTTGTSLIQQFETLLSNLINRIERLLVAPVDYINQLIQSANQFFLWLRGLWSWLPGPVVESISAVLIIMCTVGALKLLWR